MHPQQNQNFLNVPGQPHQPNSKSTPKGKKQGGSQKSKISTTTTTWTGNSSTGHDKFKTENQNLQNLPSTGSNGGHTQISHNSDLNDEKGNTQFASQMIARLEQCDNQKQKIAVL